MNTNKTYRRKSLLNQHIRKMTLTSIFLVVSIILTRFMSPYLPLFGSNSFRIGFGTIPIVLTSVVCGPFYGAICGFFADLFGALLFPSGPYLFYFGISSLLQGVFPFFVMKFLNMNKINKYILYSVLSLLSLSLISVFLFKYDNFNVGKNEFYLSMRDKLLIFFGFVLIFIILFFVIYFISRQTEKKSYLYNRSTVFNNYIVVLFNEIIILVILGSLWKQICYSIPYVICLFTASVLMVSNVIVKGIVLNILSALMSFQEGKLTGKEYIHNKIVSNQLILKRVCN